MGVVTALELGRPTDRRPPFRYAALARVGFSDTDAQGVVYYGRYMPYMDAARSEYLRHLGLLGSNVERERFAMRALSVEYHAPARFDDLLEVFVRTRRIGTSSLTTSFAAHRIEDDVLMCTAEQTSVLIDSTTGRPVPIPERLRAPIRAFEGETLEEAR
jgi:acyl-CoA thioester hydrolase